MMKFISMARAVELYKKVKNETASYIEKIELNLFIASSSIDKETLLLILDREEKNTI